MMKAGEVNENQQKCSSRSRTEIVERNGKETLK